MKGVVVGKYRVVRELGEGGMGTVYLAEHTVLRRIAALKVLRWELLHREDMVKRFFNEARAITSINHPGIVEIYDFGHHSDGRAYIVMEFLDGESLSARLRRTGMLPEPRALALCRQICGALAAAHAKGIVHRDLKPENIFIVRDSDIAGGERTKILDFGIAKLTNRMSVTGLTGMTGMTGDLTSITTIGAMIGTPAYMAPEQSEGASDVDQRADLYSLGCILFELICGRCPFTVEGAGLITAHHLFTPPPAPSSFAPVTPRLEQVILRLLAKEPEQRFGSADELLAVLQEIAEPSTRDSSAAVRIPRPPAAVRVPRVWRLPVYLALAIAVVAVFAAGRQSAGDDRPVAVQVPVSTPAPGSGDAAPQIPPAPRSPAVIPLVAAVTPAQAILHIASTPGGAEVYRMPDNVRVGVTPLRYPVGAAPEPLVLVLRKPGYREASVALTADHDLDRMVALIRKPSEGRTRPRASRPPAADEFMTRTPAPGGSSKSLRDELTERRQ